jgi:hypothetical protein
MTAAHRPTRFAILALVGALLAAAAVGWAAHSTSHPGQSAAGITLRDGPLATDSQDVEATPVVTGARLAYAGATLFNTGKAPIILESASLYPAPRGMVQIGAYVVPPGRSLNAVEFADWPQDADPRFQESIHREQPIRGALVAPTKLRPLQQGDELLVILHVPASGDHYAPYIFVRYRVGTTQYAELLPRGVVVCASAHPSPSVDCSHRFPNQRVYPGSVLTG